MIDELKKPWRVFRDAKPGKRFEKLHDARSDSPPPIVSYAAGAVLLAGGVVLLLIPGPGLFLIAFGGALIARQSLWLAKRLDRFELFFGISRERPKPHGGSLRSRCGGPSSRPPPSASRARATPATCCSSPTESSIEDSPFSHG